MRLCIRQSEKVQNGENNDDERGKNALVRSECDIQKIQENGEEIGYDLPAKKDYAYFRAFKNILDYSLDSIELECAYPTVCRKKFSFTDEKGKEYTLALINLKFSSTYKVEKQDKNGNKIKKTKVGLKELREYFYEKGFNLGGVHYVRYKRSSGSSRQGKCLFINEKAYNHMAKWGECGLKPAEDMASWEAYKSLALSSIKGTVHIPLESMLFIKDSKVAFDEDVISVEDHDGRLVSEKKNCSITNDIWDGESLLDESVFAGDYAEKHMLLLRNKFFKSCAFKTKLQKWFKDKNITSVEQLKARGFITFATDISQILMVTTPNSMKFLKFMKGGFTERNIEKWMEKVSSEFGVVKYDKRTKFFDGEMVQTSYQFLNTLGVSEEDAKTLLAPSIDYTSLIREDYDFMRYHFSHAHKRETESGREEEIADGLAERSDVIFKLMNINYAFKDTLLYKSFRNDVVESQKDRLKEGHVLLSGTNATLFGNGPEMLLALSGEFDIDNPFATPYALQKGEVACAKFADGRKLTCARSPHITMGNLYFAVNNLSNPIWEYFDLGENIVCVNAIGENIQQRLNGCDYDSDTMLITDDEFVVGVAEKQNGAFEVPVCNIRSTVRGKQALADLDYATSENKIGEIVNLSQKLNSILWDKRNKGEATEAEIAEIYQDICILAVLSGIEIDKAKRAYEGIEVGKELKTLTEKYGNIRPQFFSFFDEQEIERRVRYKEKKEREAEREKLANKRNYAFFETAMEYVSKLVGEIDYRKGKRRRTKYLTILQMLKEPDDSDKKKAYAQKAALVKLCEEYKEEIRKLYKELNCAEDDEKEIVYERIIERKEAQKAKMKEVLTSEYVLYLLLRHYDKEKCENWHIYAPFLENELFLSMLLSSKEKLCKIRKSEDGTYVVYGGKYTKIMP